MSVVRYLPRFRAAYRAIDALRAREQWSRGDLNAYQLERLNALWRHAAEQVPYYRRLADARRLPEQFSSLDEYRAAMPILPKSQVRNHGSELLSERPVAGSWDRTSGSSGTPLSVYWGKEAYFEVLRSRYHLSAIWGLDIFAPTAMLWGRGASVVSGFSGVMSRLRQSFEDQLRNRLRLSAYHLGSKELEAHLKRMAAFRPAMGYGFSNAVHLLALKAAALDFQCDSLKLFILTGEPVAPRVVNCVERAFGVPAVAEYGSGECGVMAGEWPDRTLRVCEHTTLLETLPRPDGRYDIVVTVLNNPAFPLLRYAIGDITDAPLEQPAQGFGIMHNVVGRTNDLLMTRAGRYLHPARIDAIFEYEIDGIHRYRVRQRADGSLSVALELSNGQSPNIEALRQTFERLVEGYPVHVEVVDHIPLTAAGKHRPITSDLTGDSDRDNHARGRRPTQDPTATGARKNDRSEGLEAAAR